MTALSTTLLPLRQAAPLLGISAGTLRRRAPELAKRGLAVLAHHRDYLLKHAAQRLKKQKKFANK